MTHLLIIMIVVWVRKVDIQIILILAHSRCKGFVDVKEIRVTLDKFRGIIVFEQVLLGDLFVAHGD